MDLLGRGAEVILGGRRGIWDLEGITEVLGEEGEVDLDRLCQWESGDEGRGCLMALLVGEEGELIVVGGEVDGERLTMR